MYYKDNTECRRNNNNNALAGLSCYIEALYCGGEEKKIIHNVVKFYSSYLIDSL